MPVAVGIIADSYNKPVSGFSPLSIPWHSAFWASDPGWTPPVDGAAVTSWRNAGTSAANATQSTGANQPTYRAAYTNLNGKPAVDFDGGDGLISTSASITQPNHVVVVGWCDPAGSGANRTLTDGSSNARHILRNTGTVTGTVFMNGSTAQTIAGAGRDGPFILCGLFNGATSKCRMNGTDYTVPGTVGTWPLANLRVGFDTASTNAFIGAIAFVGVSDTELTAQQITDLETWAKNSYGVPIP